MKNIIFIFLFTLLTGCGSSSSTSSTDAEITGLSTANNTQLLNE